MSAVCSKESPDQKRPNCFDMRKGHLFHQSCVCRCFQNSSKFNVNRMKWSSFSFTKSSLTLAVNKSTKVVTRWLLSKGYSFH